MPFEIVLVWLLEPAELIAFAAPEDPLQAKRALATSSQCSARMKIQLEKA